MRESAHCLPPIAINIISQLRRDVSDGAQNPVVYFRATCDRQWLAHIRRYLTYKYFNSIVFTLVNHPAIKPPVPS